MKLYVLSHSKSTADSGVAYIKLGDRNDAPEDYKEGFGSGEDTSGAGGIPGKEGSVDWIQCNSEDLKEVAQVAKDLATKLDRLDLVCQIVSSISRSTSS